jgi:hypothetical protein
MGEVRRHRWYQFGLGTMFILTAIFAWGLATRPYWRLEQARIVVSRQEFLSATHPKGYTITGGGIEHDSDEQPPVYHFDVERSRLNPRLCWPAIALVAFFTWKGFWLLRERRRSWPATQV